MPNLQVKVRNLDDETLYTHKTIRIGSKSIETPAKAISIKKLMKGEQLAAESRGVNEHYFEVDKETLENAQTERGYFKKVGQSIRKSKEGELNVVFCNYTSIEEPTHEEINTLADLLYSTSDIVTVPLMPNLLSAVKEDGVGLQSKFFERYVSILSNFISSVRQINSKPIMGTIPTAPRAFVNRIIDLYIDENLHAYAFNFNGRTVTAEDQLTDMVAPVMRKIAVEDKEEDVFLYAINAHRGRSQGNEYIPARDFMSFGFGLDVLGDKHTGGNLPPHLYEQIEESDPTFRLFKADEYAYRNYEYGPELFQNLPESSGIEEGRIASRRGDNYRLATLVNGEQQSLEARTLQDRIDEYSVTSHVRTKVGVDFDDLESMRTTRQKFESDQSQSSLSDLDGMIG